MDEGRNLSSLFTERGFTIVSASDFIREADGKDVNELLDRLTDLEKRINSRAESNTDIRNLASSVVGKLEQIDKLVNDDSYFNLSDATVRATYNEQMRDAKNKFYVARKFMEAEAEWKTEQDSYEKNIVNINQKRFKLDHDPSIPAAERNAQVFAILAEKQSTVKNYNDALENYNRCKEAYEKSRESFDLTKFRNELLSNINKIEDMIKRSILDQSLDKDNKSKMDYILETIREIRETVVLYGLEDNKTKQEFESLCKKFGIQYNKDQKTVTVEKSISVEVPKADLPTSPEPLKPQYTGPVKEEEQLAVVSNPSEEEKEDEIHRVFEELKKLNPGVELKLVGDPVNPKFDGRIESSKYVNSLHLPEDFYTINNGITNKFSSSKTPVLIEVGELKRTSEMSNEKTLIEESAELNRTAEIPGEQPTVPTPENDSLVAEPEESLFDKAKSAISKLTQESRVAGGVKYGVKKVRKAIIGPYPKTFLTFSAVTAVVASIASAPVMASAVVGGGLGAIAQALYSKTVKGTDVKIKAFEDTKYEESPEKAPVLVAAWRKGSEALMDLYKKRKSGELKKAKEAEETLSPEEELESLEQDLNQALGDYEENKSSIFDDVPSRSGR